jgi:hypothetical protein
MPSPYGQAYAVPSSQMGIAIEATRGTPVAPVAFVPYRAPKYVPTRMFLPDETLQGSMVATYNLTPGMRYDSHGWESYPYLDTFPYLIAAELGSSDTVTAAPASTTLSASAAAGATTITTSASIPSGSFITFGSAALGTLESHKTTGVTGSYTIALATSVVFAQPSGTAVTGLTQHKFSLLNNSATVGNQPPSLTLSDFDGEEWRQLAAAQMDKLSITGNATALVNYTTDFYCNPSITPSTPSVSFSTVKPVPTWTTALVISGTQSTDVEEFTIDLSRGTKPIPAVTGTLEYFQYFAGPLTATGKSTVVNTSGAPELTQYQNGTDNTFDLFINDVTTGFIMEIRSDSVIYKTGELVRSKEYVEVELSYDFLPTATDATAGGVSPLYVIVANNTSAAYYTD